MVTLQNQITIKVWFILSIIIFSIWNAYYNIWGDEHIFKKKNSLTDDEKNMSVWYGIFIIGFVLVSALPHALKGTLIKTKHKWVAWILLYLPSILTILNLVILYIVTGGKLDNATMKASLKATIFLWVILSILEIILRTKYKSSSLDVILKMEDKTRQINIVVDFCLNIIILIIIAYFSSDKIQIVGTNLCEKAGLCKPPPPPPPTMDYSFMQDN